MQDKELQALAKNGLPTGLPGKNPHSNLIGEGNIDKVFKEMAASQATRGAQGNKLANTTFGKQDQISIDAVQTEHRNNQLREYHRLMRS